MITIATYAPLFFGVLVLAYLGFTGPGKRTNLPTLVLVQFALGFGCSVWYTELLLQAFRFTADVPEELFRSGLRRAWLPTSFALVTSFLTLVVARLTRSSEVRKGNLAP